MSIERLKGLANALLYMPVDPAPMDPSHISSEFAEALEEENVETYLDDEERYGELEYRVNPQTGWEER